MVFSSHIFLFYFLPTALLLYYLVPRQGRHLMLVLVSYVFYGWANPLFLVLMLASTLTDYFSGLIISRQYPCFGSELSVRLEPVERRSVLQKGALIATIIINLTLLGVFKYFNFAIESYNSVLDSLGLEDSRLQMWFRMTLPLGISFYTFHSMSYVIDVYRGDAPAIRNFVDYACYVAMFPQLVAGPIIRFQDVAKQLVHRTHSVEKFARGVAFFSFGLAKKVLLANPCGKVADTVFNAAGVGTVEAWIGTVAYSFQIYFDFSGYSDMAIGLGLMMGFVFAKNFDSPYRAQSVTDFWRRWHISLSTWLRDYLYRPLGGNRRGTVSTYMNLMTVMLIGGMWHGAALTFLVWGFLHGAMLVIERSLGKRTLYEFLPGPLRNAMTFLIVGITWVFFRAETLTQSMALCSSMLGFPPANPAADLILGLVWHTYYLTSIAAAGIVIWTCPQTWEFTRRITLPRAAVALGLLWLSILALNTQSFNPFIYFMF